MFKISTKGDYGLVLMAALAEKAEKAKKSYVSLKTISSEKYLSLRYLSRIILNLKKAGLVKSKEGIYGGYKLAKKPSKISLMEILEALEGEITPVKCCIKCAPKCRLEKFCNAKYTWRSAISVLEDFLEGKTLADLLPKKPK